MPITQENAQDHLGLLEEWLQTQTRDQLHDDNPVGKHTFLSSKIFFFMLKPFS